MYDPLRNRVVPFASHFSLVKKQAARLPCSFTKETIHQAVSLGEGGPAIRRDIVKWLRTHRCSRRAGIYELGGRNGGRAGASPATFELVRIVAEPHVLTF